LPKNAIVPFIWTFADTESNRSFSLKAPSPTILRDYLKKAGTGAKGDFTARAAGLAPDMLAEARKTGKIYENENLFGFVCGPECELDFHSCG
jgi:hypothetical protein